MQLDKDDDSTATESTEGFGDSYSTGVSDGPAVLTEAETRREEDAADALSTRLALLGLSYHGWRRPMSQAETGEDGFQNRDISELCQKLAGLGLGSDAGLVASRIHIGEWMSAYI